MGMPRTHTALRVLCLSFLIAGLGTSCRKKEESKKEEKVSLLILYNHMSLAEVPVATVVVLKKSEDYIKFRTDDGQVVEHSGRYKIINHR